MSKKTSNLRVTGLCKGNPPVTGGFPSQRASNAENISIWWRHHALPILNHCLQIPMRAIQTSIQECWESIVTCFDKSSGMKPVLILRVIIFWTWLWWGNVLFKGLTYRCLTKWRCFADDILKCMLSNVTFCILTKFASKFVPGAQLIIVTWWHQAITWTNADHHLSPYGITGSQWVKKTISVSRRSRWSPGHEQIYRWYQQLWSMNSNIPLIISRMILWIESIQESGCNITTFRWRWVSHPLVTGGFPSPRGH